MQALAPDINPTAPPHTEPRPARLVITLEAFIYGLLLIFAVVMRVADLDSVVISEAEAPAALAAWHSTLPGDLPLLSAPTSPTVFWAQRIGFTLFGANELAARLLTALAGAALVLTPLLFRDLLGPRRALAFAVLLTLSPTLLLASRFSAPIIWSLLFAVAMLWFGWRYWQRHEQGDGVAAVVAGVALLLLAEPGGLLLLLMLGGALLLALSLTATDTANDDDAGQVFSQVRARLATWPLATGVGFGALLTVVVATGFMFYPAGLSSVGALVAGVAGGLGATDLTPLGVALFYEPLLWVFAAASLIVTTQRGGLTLLDRFFVAWLSLGVLAMLLFNAETYHALWITLPLMGMAAGLLADVFRDDRSQALWVPLQDEDADINRLYTTQWGRAILALVSLGLFIMLALHLQIVAREALLVEGGRLDILVTRIAASMSPVVRGGGLWTLVTILFLIVGFFLAASIWGRTTTLQGAALGLLIFMGVNGLSSGWDAAVFRASSPVEPWHGQAASSSQLHLLRQTLTDLSRRQTAGEPELPVTVVLDPTIGLTRDSAAAWVLRDFTNVQYVTDAGAARAREIVLMRAPDSNAVTTDALGVLRPVTLDLGGSYVGQRFALRNTWNAGSMQGLDFMAHWFQRRTRVAPQPDTPVVLWVRLDIYNSRPFTPASGR